MDEKLKNMSPEELKEFQKKQCIFCHIISGKVQSRKIFSDDTCTAVLDINPANPGHILLLPNEHYPIMPLIPDDVVGKLFVVARSLSNALLKALKAEGTTIFAANGLVAGQKAQHFMIHIIPRMPNDGIEFKLPQKQMMQKDMDEVHKRVTKRLNELLGIKTQEESAPAAKKLPKQQPKVQTEVDLDTIARFLQK